MAMVLSAHKNKTLAQLQLQKTQLEKQREIAENTLKTQENERQRLGFELHDDLGPSFSAVRLMLSQIEGLVNNGETKRASEQISLAQNSLMESIQKFSDVSRILYPAALNRNGLKRAIEDVVEQCNAAFGEKVIHFSYSVADINKELVELTIYRICQELINNGVKHAKASNISIALTEDNEFYHVNYSDNGVGFDMDSKANGLGLQSLNGRCDALNGEMHFKSELGIGTSAQLQIPK